MNNLLKILLIISVLLNIVIGIYLFKLQWRSDLVHYKGKYYTLKNSYIELAFTQSEIFELLLENKELKTYLPEYDDLSSKEFEEGIRRKIIALKLEIDQLKQEQ
jgi:hypothetical protein